jgi:hypothetical protein
MALLRGRRVPAAIASALLACAVLVGAPAGSVAEIRVLITQPADVKVFKAGFGFGLPGPTVPDSGVASSYPATSTLGATEADVVDVDVTLKITHDRPADLDIMIVSPDGRQATVMSDVGGDTPVSGLELTLDDEAATPLPENGPLVSGTYRPADYGGIDGFPAPAPPSTGLSALSALDRTPVTGSWRLYVVDDTAGAAGAINQWGFNIKEAGPPYPSELVVPPGVGLVTDLDVHVSGLTMSHGEDLDLMLVGPQGQRAMLISDAGGTDPLESVDLVLDDEAGSALPDATTFGSGRYRPTDHPGPDDFVEPAPPPGGSSLSAFDGTDPRGVWRLYAIGPFLNPGVISSWSLDLAWTDGTAPSGSVTVDGGAAVTTDPGVSLAVAAADPPPGTGVTRMRFSNDGVTWSAFQPPASAIPWELAGGDGVRTVYAQFEDGAGNVSAPVADTIRLDTLGPRAVGLRPARKATRVRRGVTVRITLSEALRAGSVTKKTVLLVRPGRPGRVKATVRYVASRQRIVVDPKRRLAAGAKYRVKVSTAVVDLVGHAWDQSTTAGAQPLAWTFKTR